MARRKDRPRLIRASRKSSNAVRGEGRDASERRKVDIRLPWALEKLLIKKSNRSARTTQKRPRRIAPLPSEKAVFGVRRGMSTSYSKGKKERGRASNKERLSRKGQFF